MSVVLSSLSELLRFGQGNLGLRLPQRSRIKVQCRQGAQHDEKAR